jgi:hypothetical protein
MITVIKYGENFTMNRKYKGSCLCGGITFCVESFAQQAANCYCTMCRKFHGAAFGTLVGVSGLTWLSGKGLLKHFIAPNDTTRTFCDKCGTSLGFRIKGASIEALELAIATFDESIPVEIDAQIYTNYKANWCQLQGNLPVFDEGRIAQ